ncbi:DNA polymerase III subunit epsilon [Flavobacterium sp. 316]|nr:DNA polymerase III subunit epsilon [Flavobacterium sp. 316]
MEIPFFKNMLKDYPKFWEEYLSHFENKQDLNRYVIFDLEITGLDVENDRILSISAIGANENTVLISDFIELFIEQSIFNPESVPYHGILKEGKEEKVVEAEAIIQFLNFIKNATLVGHNIDSDIEMINHALGRLNVGKLKNQYMDINIMYQKLKDLPENHYTSLDELCDIYKIRKTERHTSSGDSYIMSLIFLKLKRKLGI